MVGLIDITKCFNDPINKIERSHDKSENKLETGGTKRDIFKNIKKIMFL